MESTPTQEDKDQIIFTNPMKKDLKTTSHWSVFISVFTLLMMAISFFTYAYILYNAYSLSGIPLGEILAEMPWQGYVLILLITTILLILILASTSLLLFSFEIKKAINYENSNAMDLAIELLLRFFRYNGIFIIGVFLIVFSIYIYSKSFNI